MGYETLLIVGYPYTHIPSLDKHPLVNRVAEVDLSNAGYNTFTGRLLAKRRAEGDHFGIYAHDGNTRLFEDLVGDEITDVPLQDLIEALEKDQETNGEYRRFTLALAILKTFRDDPSWGHADIRVLQFGH